MAPLLKFLTKPLSAVYQHFSNEENQFCSNLASCSKRLPGLSLNHSQSLLYTFVCFLLIIFKKRLLKFDQELSACWKKSYGLRYLLPTHWSYFTGKISVNLFGSGSDRCGSGSCLQIYRFHIPGYR